MDGILWGYCLECGNEINGAGYCKPCIERLHGAPLPATIGCADCLGEGVIDGVPCVECDGTGQVAWPD